MRTIIEVQWLPKPVRLRMFIHNAPHRRMHHAVLSEYRKELWVAWKFALGDLTDIPISESVDLDVTFINPLSPDLDNLITALFQALDGKTGKGPTILKDDGLISSVRAGLLRS